MFQLLFSIYLLLYFRYTEGDVLAYLLSRIMDESIEPRPWLTAIVLTLAFVAVAQLAEKLIRCNGYEGKSAYAVAAWAAAMLTSWHFVSPRYHILLTFAGFVVTILTIAIGRWKDGNHEKTTKIPVQSTEKIAHGTKYITRHTESANTPSFWRKCYPRLLQLLLLFLFLGIGSGTTDLQHYELRTAQALQTGHYKRAYHTGDKSYVTSPRLFAMRCYLMARSQKKGLGEKAFEQMVPPGGSKCLLLPTDHEQQLLFPADSLYHLLGSMPHKGESALKYFQRCAWISSFNGKPNRAAIDYYLTALLLERNLPQFANEVVRYYPRETAQNSLPTYFAQAMVLYKRICECPIVDYHDSSIEANYTDYQDMGDTIANTTIRRNTLRYSYGETYWWWYQYGSH